MWSINSEQRNAPYVSKKHQKLILILVLLGSHTGQWWLDTGLELLFHTVRIPAHADGLCVLKNLPELITSSENEKEEKPLMFEFLSPTFLCPTQGPQILLFLYQKPRKCCILKAIFTQVRKLQKWQAFKVTRKWSSNSATGTSVLIRVQISEPAEPSVLGACKMQSLQEIVMNHSLAVWEVLKAFKLQQQHWIKEAESALATWLIASTLGRKPAGKTSADYLQNQKFKVQDESLSFKKVTRYLQHTASLPAPSWAFCFFMAYRLLWNTKHSHCVTALWTTFPAMNMIKLYQLHVEEVERRQSQWRNLKPIAEFGKCFCQLLLSGTPGIRQYFFIIIIMFVAQHSA